MCLVLITHQSKGFTLIEILVAVVILAIGLLGLASLQTLSMKDNQDAYLYSQASALAYDMSDRIRANAFPGTGGWVDAIPATVSSAPSPSCNSVAQSCTPAQMASYDLFIWQQNVTDKLVNVVSATVVASPVGTCTGPATARCIRISWTRGHQTTSATTSLFELEVSL